MADDLAQAIVLAADKLHKQDGKKQKFAVLEIRGSYDGVNKMWATVTTPKQTLGPGSIPWALTSLSESRYQISNSLMGEITALLKEKDEGFEGFYRFLLTRTED